MKILIIPNNMVNNCFGVRNYLPAKFLSSHGHEVRFKQRFEVYEHPTQGKTIDPADLDWADVVVFNRHYDVGTNTLLNVMKYCKVQGKLVVYETDDLLDQLDASNPMFQDMQGHKDQVRMMASFADVCTTTGPDIRRELMRYNDNVKVLPNCVKLDTWGIRPRSHKRLRVGWAGGSSHAADLQIVIDVVKRLKEEHDFDFVIFGLSDKPWRQHVSRLKKRHLKQARQYPNMRPATWYTETMKLAEMLEGLKFEHVPFVQHSLYNEKLRETDLDVGLCPLVDTIFNRCKSAIKFYEYAMVGTACLSSKMPPYEGEVKYCAKDRSNDWYKKLKRLIVDAEFRQALQEEQRAWVLANRDIQQQGYKWEQVYLGEDTHFDK